MSSEISEVTRLQAEVGRLQRKIDRLKMGLEELEGITERRTRELFVANNALGRFIPPQVRDLLARGDDSSLLAKRAYVSIVFGDLKGFTDLAEVIDAEQMMPMMNDYFDMVLKLVGEHGGLLDKFIGDGFMAFWGAPGSVGREADAIKCGKFALALQRGFAVLAEGWQKKGLDHHITLRQGIHSGFCSVGNFGSSKRLQYTAMGSPVNLASRLESAAPPGAILISHTTSAMVSPVLPVKEYGRIDVKGIKHPVTTYTLEQEQTATPIPEDLARLSNLLTQMEETQQIDRKTMELLMKQLASQKPNGPANMGMKN